MGEDHCGPPLQAFTSFVEAFHLPPGLIFFDFFEVPLPYSAKGSPSYVSP